MSIRINAEPFEYDYEVSGSMDNIQVDADALEYNPYLKGLYSTNIENVADRNPDLDQLFNCLSSDEQGVLNYDLEISGSWLNKSGDATVLNYAYEIAGTFVESIVIDGSVGLEYHYEILDDFYYEMDKVSWVKWSDIGHLNFEITQSNQAGERPMEWTGLIYDIIKFNEGVIVYGANGIAEMKPAKNTWTYRTLYAIGTKGRDCQISNITNTIHWFIDTLGQLWEVGESLKKLDYSEFLLSLSNPIMTINEQDHLIYICDGTNGYVYNYADKSLSKGYANISGYGYRNSTVYIVSPAIIATPNIAFTTNTYDMGTRKEKTIYQVEVSSYMEKEMSVAIKYRTANNESFSTTPWAKVTQRGIAYIPCYGIEFQLKGKLDEYEDINIDQIKINGQIHGFSFLDTVRKEN